MSYQIMIVDDEKEIVRLIKDCLELEGFRVLVAYDGIQAIEA